MKNKTKEYVLFHTEGDFVVLNDNVRFSDQLFELNIVKLSEWEVEKLNYAYSLNSSPLRYVEV